MCADNDNEDSDINDSEQFRNTINEISKIFVAFFGTQIRGYIYIYIYICKRTIVGRMARVTGIVKLVKNMM